MMLTTPEDPLTAVPRLRSRSSRSTGETVITTFNVDKTYTPLSFAQDCSGTGEKHGQESGMCSEEAGSPSELAQWRDLAGGLGLQMTTGVVQLLQWPLCRWPLSRTQNSSEMYQSPTPLDCRLSEVSSQWGQHDSEDYVHPHYKEEYRLAIYALVSGGREAYDNFLKSEQMGNFLSEQELRYILQNVKQMKFDLTEENSGIMSDTCSSDTYWPVESDLETPDLELGWPQGTPDVIAIVMDVFTDVDIFKDIVEASLMGVAVYILLNDFHLTSFLSMAEQHDVHIQRLKLLMFTASTHQPPLEYM
ncbi:hypothetical protein JZ751_013869 [Albula glossodonta]|uniref:Scaffolding anchor of CK1 domain-containing protein n=1 Tax=Albula glossodonta TaxID=121402 RepID=A0A8T2MMY8_9TELE|nr:hypothetical protein JZ751_013869 [Albula glossodonta]